MSCRLSFWGVRLNPNGPLEPDRDRLLSLASVCSESGLCESRLLLNLGIVYVVEFIHSLQVALRLEVMLYAGFR